MKSPKKKILFITRNFPPLIGGMEKLHFHVFSELQKYYEVAIAGPNGCSDYVGHAQHASFAHSPKMKFVMESYLQARALAKEFQPDLIFCGSGTTAFAGRFIALELRIPFVCLIQGLDVIAPSWIYQRFFVGAIKHASSVISISEYTQQLAIDRGISRERINILHPGVDSTHFRKGQPKNKLFAKERQGKFILLSVGRLTKRKGIFEFIQHVLPELKKRIPNVLFLVIGGDPDQALNAETGQTEKISALVKQSGLQDCVELAGKVDDDFLHAAYSYSDLFVFPVLNIPGDVEGFGMVAIEAAANGLPTIAFANGGVVDAVKDKVSGLLINSGDYEAMTDAISDLAKGKISFSKTHCQSFAQQFDWQHFGVKLSRLIDPANFSQ